MAPFSFYTDLPTKTFAIDQITNVDRVNEYRMSNKEFRMMKFDELVRSRKTPFVVIPAQAGIQAGTFFLDTRLRGCDGCDDSSDTP
jgi:hypothetical protein